MSRQFNSRNVERPIGVEAILRTVPKCFDAFVWELYVDEAWRSTLNDRAARRRLERGVPPAYCAECTFGHREKMLALGRCHPPSAGKTIPIVEEAVHGF